MGPIALFDKSFLQSLSVDEAMWFDLYFLTIVCPLFYVETLADLSKTNLPAGRTGDREVAIIAEKTPEFSGTPCVHHVDLCIGDLMGHHVSMRRQIPMAGGRWVKAKDGRTGVAFDAAPEAKAFGRWQQGEFREVERDYARQWRAGLANLDLKTVAKKMQALGIDSGTCKSLAQAHAIATSIVSAKRKPFEQMALLVAFAHIQEDVTREVLRRWAIAQYAPLATYAPYAAHVLTVELFFQIALAANLISSERPSNRIDIAYLFYLPFCMLFVSSDKLHRSCAPLFLTPDQDFVWGPDLKAELRRTNEHFSALPDAQKELGAVRLARKPVGAGDALMTRLWDRHSPGWRAAQEPVVPMNPDAEKKLVEHLKEFTNAPPSDGPPDLSDEVENLSIQRFVRKHRGSWWQLAKDLKDEGDGQDGSSV